MQAPFMMIHSHLARVSARWKRLRGVTRSSIAFAVTCLFALLLGVAMWRGWITSPGTAIFLAALLSIAAGCTLLVIFIATAGPFLDRAWLAGESEKANPQFLDRLNTLTHFEKGRTRNEDLSHYLARVRRQAAENLESETKLPFSSRSALLGVFVALLAATGTGWFYVHWKPWRQLATDSVKLAAKSTDSSFELAQNQVETSNKIAAPWGEVRITEPGRDLKLTKVDVVAMKIEAASNQTLKQVRWEHSVNGGKPTSHELDPPAEPSYAAYDPIFYLDELRVSDWDVVSYFAEASADNEQHYSSEIYFIEIRPFRSDLAKMPGGAEGKAARSLAQMSDLIERQQQILRETRRFQGRNYSKPELQTQDRGKLESAEGSLRDATEAEYARIATTLENQPIGEMLDGLAKADESMRRATEAIGTDAVPAGQQHELTALKDLIATRKNLQKYINEHPESFRDKEPQENEPIADPLEALAKVTEFRDKQQAARDGVDDLLDEQRQLRDSFKGNRNTDRAAGASKQDELQKKLEQLQQENPELFRGAQAEAQAADKAMEAAKATLQQNSPSNYRLNRAVDRLQDLQQALAQRDPARQMEQAFRMKRLLDQQTGQMQKGAKGDLTKEEMQKLSQAAKATAGELKDFADSDPAGFGPQLQKALSDQAQQKLDQQLQQAGEGKSQAERQAAAGKAAGEMEKISDAFEKSMPQVAENKQSGGQQSGGSDDALSRSLRELQSLVQHGENGRRLSPEQESQQREEAMANLKDGLAQLDSKAQAAVILQHAEDELRQTNRPVNVEALRKLLDEIENFRVELSDRKQREALESAMTRVDPARVSPMYRERVQEYYRRLSEQ